MVGDRRDVDAFSARADGYDDGWLGRFHHDVAQRVASVVESGGYCPRRLLDVGCGSGYLLRLLAARFRLTETVVGIDPSSTMVGVARARSSDTRIQVLEAKAEQLPFACREFDLVVSTTSFDHWCDQAGGLRECARVLDENGAVVIADLFSPVLVPTLVGTRRHKARTRARIERLLTASGLRLDRWHKIHTLIQAFVAHPDDGC
jgi:ubiquinone/menaquinone biosynthesis C-methylase UbiE